MQGYKTWKVKNDIPEDLWNEVKAFAILCNQTTGEYIAEALRGKVRRDKEKLLKSEG